MRINHNIMAINNYRQLTNNSNQASKSLEKLSSGQSINRAGDNAAGLAISEKMRGQIRGLGQAGNNAQDAISLIKTAEGGLSETHSIIQRMRELAVQAANDVNAGADREAIQSEIDQLAKEVDRIGNNTEFNTKKLLNQGNAAVSAADQQNLISSLKKWWLAEAEDLVFNSYGISASGVDMTVEFVNDTSPGAYAAAVIGGFQPSADALGPPTITGPGTAGGSLTLSINLAYSQPTDTADGGTAPQYVDRVIAHEMTHAVMMSTMNFGDLPTWFVEGVAEFTHGGDERLQSAGTLEAVRDNFGTGLETQWDSTSVDYASAYLAVRYMDQQIIAGGGNGIEDVLQHLATNSGSTLDDALDASASPTTNTADFIASFTGIADGGIDSAARIDFAVNASGQLDTGSAIGSDAGGSTGDYNAEDIMPDAIADGTLSGFNITWPDLADSAAQSFNIQIGANTGQSMAISTSDMRADALGISSLNVNSHTAANAAIGSCDSAISRVSAERSRLGAYQNRLEHTIKNLESSSENLTSSESRIRDVDMAREMMQFTKTNILTQAAQAMLSQANQQPQGVLQLLA